MPPFEPIHWGYSTQFGTGWYDLDGTRSVFMLHLPLRQSWNGFEPWIDEWADSARIADFELLYPVTVGLHAIDDLGVLTDGNNFATLSFTPGLELEIIAAPNWRLRPFAHFGYGYQFETDSGAWLYDAGIKSLYQLQTDGTGGQWALLTRLVYSGFDEGEQSLTDGLFGAELGLGYSHAWRSKPEPGSVAAGPALRADWHLSWEQISQGLPLFTPTRASAPASQPVRFQDVDAFIELGMVVGPSGRNWDFRLWKPARLGLALQVSPDGDYFAVKFITDTWFRR